MLAAKIYKIKEAESETSPGVLYSSGLIAGGALTGIAIALLKGFKYMTGNFITVTTGNSFLPSFTIAEYKPLSEVFDFYSRFNLEAVYGASNDLVAVVFFGLMAATLLYMAGDKSSANGGGNENEKTV